MNLAERLGYRPEDRVLIVHADDVGVSHAANQAAFEAMEGGSITCGSILVPCPWFAEVAEHCRIHPAADFGVHLTLNCEYPLYRWRAICGRERAPTLYDEQGYMWLTTQEAVVNVSPEDGAREMRAQIDTALAAGIDVTHLDTHMGTVIFPKFIESYISLSIEYRLPLFLIRPSRELLESRGMLEFWEALEPQAKRAEEAGLPILDAILTETLGLPPEEKEAYFKDLFAGLEPGVTHFLIHPAKPSDELSSLATDAPGRAKDYELFRDGSMRDFVEGLGIHLIGYREIREAYRAGALKS
jgi:predicted glycoside hydrolase/deacetylase ChbG (UPF0249 family)